jgi:hypothetical protein
MSNETIMVRMLASRRSPDYRHTRGDTPTLPADLAERFIHERAAVPLDRPAPEQSSAGTTASAKGKEPAPRRAQATAGRKPQSAGAHADDAGSAGDVILI